MWRIAAMAIVCVVAASALPAQSRPSFAGEWVRTIDSAAARPAVAAAGDVRFRTGDMGVPWGSPLTIRQTSDSLVAEFVHFGTYDLQPRLRYAFALSGAESRNAVMIGHQESVQRSRVAWQGETLVITTAFATPPGAAPGPSVESRLALSLSPAGALTIEVTRPDATGPNIVRATYTKR